jgi:hypothetical protein
MTARGTSRGLCCTAKKIKATHKLTKARKARMGKSQGLLKKSFRIERCMGAESGVRT